MKFLIGLLLTVFVSAPSFASTCFFKDYAVDFRVQSPTWLTVYSPGEQFDVEVFSCFELLHADKIAFEPRPINSVKVCKGDNLLVLDSFNNNILQRCAIRNIEKRDR